MPGFSFPDHDVLSCQEFSHGCDESNQFGIAVVNEAVVEGFGLRFCCLATTVGMYSALRTSTRPQTVVRLPLIGPQGGPTVQVRSLLRQKFV